MSIIIFPPKLAILGQPRATTCTPRQRQGLLSTHRRCARNVPTVLRSVLRPDTNGGTVLCSVHNKQRSANAV